MYSPWLVISLLLLFLRIPCWSATLLVSPTDEAPFSTITSALMASTSGDTILVSAGIYAVTTGESFPLQMKTGVSVRSASPTEKPEIHASGGQVVMEFKGISKGLLEGFRITGGQTETKGAGLSFSSTTSIIRNCIITGNRARGSGGGILCTNGSSPVIEDCLIEKNTGDSFGGGAHCENGSSPVFRRCVFYANSGGGVSCQQGASPRFISCQFLDNQAVVGAGVFCSSAAPHFLECMISGNRADMLLRPVGGGLFCTDSTVILKGCLVSNNTAKGEGGGIIADQSTVFLNNCAVVGNSTGGKGGGLLLTTFSDAHLTNCIIAGNKSSEGGAFFSAASSTQASGCTIQGNTAPAGAWLSTGDLLSEDLFSHVSLANSVIRNGTSSLRNEDQSVITVWNSNVQGGFAGTGNLDSDPLFISNTSGTWSAVSFPSASFFQTALSAAPSSNWLPNQFADGSMFLKPDTSKATLFPIVSNTTQTLMVWGDASDAASPGGSFEILSYRFSAGSPCIDSGSNTLHGDAGDSIWSLGDYEGRVRAADGNGDGISEIDMGAFEFGDPPLVGDMNGDESINALDLFQVHRLWKSELLPAPVPGDQNGDRRLDSRDLLCLLRGW